MVEYPTDEKAEKYLAIAYGLLSIVPYAGGILAGVGKYYFDPLEQRRKQWVIDVSGALNEIEKRFAILPEILRADEHFISFLLQATEIALRNHQVEKLQALKAAVIASIDPAQPSEDLAFQFLKYVDELTVTHVRILVALEKDEAGALKSKSLEEAFSNLTKILPQPLERSVFRTFLHDLDARGLIWIGDVTDFSEYESGQSYPILEDSKPKEIAVTAVGHSFLTFIGRSEAS